MPTRDPEIVDSHFALDLRPLERQFRESSAPARKLRAESWAPVS